MRNFWKNKKVFITGHTGFKGSWLSLWLSHLNSEVMGYSLPLSKNEYLFKKLNLKDKIKNIKGDINDYKKLKRILNKFNPDIIFHLAAQPLVLDSYINPKKTFKTNISGTINLLECSRNLTKLKSIIVVTSDKCYENNDLKYNFKENDKLGGDDPYSASKAAAEIVTSSYYKSFLKNVGVATVRSGNVIGGGDNSKNRIVPDIMNSINKKNKLVLRNPNSTRPWQHVFETLNGYIILCEKLSKNKKKYSGAWNFGPKSLKISVKEIAQKIIKASDSKIKIKIYNENKFHEKNFLYLNSSKANKILKWKNKWNIDKSINQIVEWNHYSNNKDIMNLSLSQLTDYIKHK